MNSGLIKLDELILTQLMPMQSSVSLKLNFKTITKPPKHKTQHEKDKVLWNIVNTINRTEYI